MSVWMSMLAQGADAQPTDAAMGALAGVFFLVYMVVVVLMIAAAWKIFTKANQPGWAAIIPIYNLVVLLNIVGRPVWWIILFFVPFVNFIAFIMVSLDLAKSFGKDTLFGLGLAFLSPIFYPILGFGSAQYTGPSAS
jgi:chromate transport protein ChrA